MAGASARAHARAKYKKTEPLDLHLHEAPRREDGTVATLRIVPVGKAAAARSGGTLQINCTVRPVHHTERVEPEAQPQQPEVVYARPVWSAPIPVHQPVKNQTDDPWAEQRRGKQLNTPTSLIPAHGENLADLQLRAAHALAGLQAGLQSLQTQGIDLRKWSKSSTAWTAAVAVYALVLFLIAILTS